MTHTHQALSAKELTLELFSGSGTLHHAVFVIAFLSVGIIALIYVLGTLFYREKHEQPLSEP